MEDYEFLNRWIRNVSIILLLVLVPMIVYVTLVLTGVAVPFIDIFAVDSEGNLYIAEYDTISVYDDQSKLEEININRKRPWRFTITENDEIWCCTASAAWRVDLEGTELERRNDPSAQMYSRLQLTFRDEDGYGNIYSRVSYLGRTKIVKNNTEVVYQISLLSYFVKLLLYFAVASFIIGLSVIVKESVLHSRTKQD